MMGWRVEKLAPPGRAFDFEGMPNVARPGVRCLCILVGATLALAVARAAIAEAVFDGSIGPNPDGATVSGDFTIDESDGTTQGANLFHSFRVFDVDAGESASFTTTSAVQRIIARVTGDASQGNLGSTIAGPLSVDPGVSFHLLNPMGILFAEGGQVDVSGSVFLTTANGLAFDQPVGGPITFRVDAPMPMLTSDPPVAYVFDPGSTGLIEFRGDPGGGPGSFTRFDFGADADVDLIASDVSLDAAGVFSQAGVVRVAAVGAEGTSVPLDVASWSPGAGAGEIDLSRTSLLCMDQALCAGASDTLADRGRIVIRGGRFSVDDSRMIASGDGSNPWAIDAETSGQIEITGTETLITSSGLGTNAVGGIRMSASRIDVRNTDPASPIRGIRLASGRAAAPLLFEADAIHIDDATVQTFASGDGAGADIQLASPSITIGGGAIVATTSQQLAVGDAGTVSLAAGPAGSIEVREASRVTATTEGAGQTGALRLTGSTVSISGGSIVKTESRETATGDAGSIYVDVGRNGSLFVGEASQLAATTLGSGGAGRIQDGRRLGVSIRAGDMRVESGAQVFSTTDGAGNAGNLEIEVDGTLTISGVQLSNPAGLFAQSGPDQSSTATGDGGAILITARSMEVLEGGGIGASTSGVGAAGSMVFDLDETLLVDGAGTFVTAEGNIGPGGAITIGARNIRVSNGASVSAISQLSGNAGTISIDAGDSLVVDGGSVRTDLRGVGSNALGGDIALDAKSFLIVRNGGRVSTAGASIEDAGSIVLASDGVIGLQSGAAITAAASNAGDAGDIEIDSARFFAEDASVTTDSTQSAGGRIRVATSRELTLEGSLLESSVQTSGDGSGGDVTLSGARVIINGSQLIADAIEGPGGNLLISGEGVLISSDSVLRAKSSLGIDGEIFISSPDTNLIDRLQALPETMLTTSSQLAARCDARDPAVQSSFVVGQRGATPATPDRWLGPPVFGTRMGGAAEGLLSVEVEAALRRGDEAGAAEMLAALLDGASALESTVHLALAAADVSDALGSSQAADTHRLQALSWARSLDDAALVNVAEADIAAAPSAAPPSPAELDVLRRAEADDSMKDLDRARVAFRSGAAAWRAGLSEEAATSFERSAAHAHAADAMLARARALAMAARIATEREDTQAAIDTWQRAAAAIGEAPASSMLAETRIHLAETARALGAREPQARTLAYTQLIGAKDEAEAAADARTSAAAWAGLARLYEDEARTEEALDLAREAARLAKQSRTPELLYRVEWQVGRLLALQGEATSAIAAYDRALDELESLRFETPPPRRDHREDVAAVYYGLVDLLLRADTASGSEIALQDRLQRARDVVETSKASELRDYFRDPCVDALVARKRSVDEVAQHALIVYPIPLPDRLELLVTGANGQMSRITVPVTGEELEQEVRRFRRLLGKRSTRQYLGPARTLYDWLIRPLETLLDDSSVETLVFVPDGSLRTIPMAALQDGERFLIERVALAVTPSIAMTDPRAIPAESIRALIGGLSAGREGFPPLPHVPQEIDAIASEIGGDTMLDAQFNIEAIEALIAETEYNLLHFATHAEFGGDGKESFLLTYDGRLSVERLDSLISRFRYREEPLELLGLSACETAAGDDRAALGLSGIAVRAGARSVLGTLWSVNDRATTDLVTRFYAELSRPGVSRAEALRRAQLQALGEADGSHPYYWAAFILINSWL